MSSRLFLAFALAALVGCGGGGKPVTPPPTQPPAQNRAPSASITAPQDGATLASPTVTLQAQATDPEDGTLSGAALKWSSSVDGALGTGSPLEVTLSRGAHRLTLEVTDSGGKTAQAQISLTVSPPDVPPENRPPVAVIDAPAAGTSVHEGEPLLLEGHATDPEDGALTGASLTWTSDKAGALGTGTEVTFPSTVLGEHHILLTAMDAQGLAAYASTTVVVLRAGANLPPVVTLSQPVDGTQVREGEALTLQGSATDAEDGVLPDPALAWTSSVDGALGTGARLTGIKLSRGAHLLTLTATDSLGARASATVSVSVTTGTNAAPTVRIDSPTDGFTLFENTALTLSGTATDPEDGTLSGAALVWKSSLDGALGTGSPLTVPRLSKGTHDVLLTATDGVGNAATARIRVVVLHQNTAPTTRIDSPADGSRFTAGTTISLRGTATDAEDGALSGNSLTWQSNLDGVLGHGASLDVASLREGSHTVSLVAMDSEGRVGSASLQLTIDPAPVKLPPVARLTGPTQGEARQALTFDGAGSSDPDGTLTRYRFDFGDGQPAVEGTAAQATHTFQAAGTFTVTLTVTDNTNLTASTTLTVTVAPYVRRPRVLAEGTERYGTTCRLAMRGTVAQLAYLGLNHPSLWYGTFDGTTWTSELVDGPGFGVGGFVGDRFALAVAADGTPHLVYTRSGQGIWYATRTGGAWVRERVDTSATVPWFSEVSIALDPSQSSRPTVAWTGSKNVGGTDMGRIVIATRSAPGTWSAAHQTFSTSDHQVLSGDIVFDTAGKLYLPFTHEYVGTWKAGTLESLLVPEALGSDWISSAWRSTGPLFLATDGLHAVTMASPFPNSTTRLSSVEGFTLTTYAVAVDSGGNPRLAIAHDGTLEVARPGTGALWERTDLGAVDTSRIGAAVDSEGETRACFYRARKLLLY